MADRERSTRGDPIDAFEIGLCCGMLLQASLPEFIETAARHGFPTITARPAKFAEALEAGFTERQLRRLLAEAGVRVTMVDALTKGLPGVHRPRPSIRPCARF